MGGSGGGDYSPGTYNAPSVDCQRLRFNTILASPDPDVVVTVAIQDTADVVLAGDVPHQAIEVWTRGEGAVLGAIVDEWADLQRCLRSGVRFVADIVTTTSPVRVAVRPRPSLDCAALTAVTRLHLSGDSTPRPIGTDLSVVLDTNRQFGEQVRVVDPASGADLGWVRCHPIDLPDCLAAEHRFHATVETADSELTVVRVEAQRHVP
jgi:hypothetical protein